eukprot:TRINITY_DN8444_c0_g1_i1.p1 TRINITY_DN8444_c0_g1~~TRINITY_DN8444_c0_g1_i1.p1  ORF type:complete len:491 (+),score=113.95 TRINITY_DN8444_c0_g1_i1:39-1475(+)
MAGAGAAPSLSAMAFEVCDCASGGWEVRAVPAALREATTPALEVGDVVLELDGVHVGPLEDLGESGLDLERWGTMLVEREGHHVLVTRALPPEPTKQARRAWELEPTLAGVSVIRPEEEARMGHGPCAGVVERMVQQGLLHPHEAAHPAAAPAADGSAIELYSVEGGADDTVLEVPEDAEEYEEYVRGLYRAIRHFQAEGRRMEAMAREQHEARVAAEGREQRLRAQLAGLKAELAKRDLRHAGDSVLRERSVSPASRRRDVHSQFDSKRLRNELLTSQGKLASAARHNAKLRQALQSIVDTGHVPPQDALTDLIRDPSAPTRHGSSPPRSVSRAAPTPRSRNALTETLFGTSDPPAPPPRASVSPVPVPPPSTAAVASPGFQVVRDGSSSQPPGARSWHPHSVERSPPLPLAGEGGGESAVESAESELAMVSVEWEGRSPQRPSPPPTFAHYALSRSPPKPVAPPQGDRLPSWARQT